MRLVLEAALSDHLECLKYAHEKRVSLIGGLVLMCPKYHLGNIRAREGDVLVNTTIFYHSIFTKSKKELNAERKKDISTFVIIV